MLGTEHYLHGDTNALTPLALPLTSSASSAFPTAYARRNGQDEYEDSHGIAKVDPSTFVLPPNARTRFQHFLRLFSLATYDPTSSTIRPSSAKEQKKGKAVKMLKEHEHTSLEWHVWAFCPSCYY
jgi:tripartite-type tricarboxylate transporter receptor subunit TctC